MSSRPFDELMLLGRSAREPVGQDVIATSHDQHGYFVSPSAVRYGVARRAAYNSVLLAAGAATRRPSSGQESADSSATTTQSRSSTGYLSPSSAKWARAATVGTAGLFARMWIDNVLADVMFTPALIGGPLTGSIGRRFADWSLVGFLLAGAGQAVSWAGLVGRIWAPLGRSSALDMADRLVLALVGRRTHRRLYAAVRPGIAIGLDIAAAAVAVTCRISLFRTVLGLAGHPSAGRSLVGLTGGPGAVAAVALVVASRAMAEWEPASAVRAAVSRFGPTCRLSSPPPMMSGALRPESRPTSSSSAISARSTASAAASESADSGIGLDSNPTLDSHTSGSGSGSAMSTCRHYPSCGRRPRSSQGLQRPQHHVRLGRRPRPVQLHARASQTAVPALARLLMVPIDVCVIHALACASSSPAASFWSIRPLISPFSASNWQLASWQFASKVGLCHTIATLCELAAVRLAGCLFDGVVRTREDKPEPTVLTFPTPSPHSLFYVPRALYSPPSPIGHPRTLRESMSSPMESTETF